MFSEELEAIVLFIFVVWSSASSTLTFGQAANKIRDEILIGKIGQDELLPVSWTPI